MRWFSRARIAFKALRELGLPSVCLYALYRLGLWSGYFRRKTVDGGRNTIDEIGEVQAAFVLRPIFDLPDGEKLVAILGEEGKTQLLAEADEIVAGRVRLFGGSPVAIKLIPDGPLRHWTEYELGVTGEGEETIDIKFIWEVGRFGWAYTLARAYHISRDERYAQAFWEYTRTFIEANPPGMGRHWISGQEVALRLIAMAFSWNVLRESIHSTADRADQLGRAIAAHAGRIPPTMVYARSQNNNHLLTEAAGIYTAGTALPEHPQAKRWRELGWRWLNRGFQQQIAEDGTYIQHSANYHRLMLQVALWARLLAHASGQDFPELTLRRLAGATRWLLALLDEDSGQTPNLGPNDGAYIQPLSVCPFQDYRPGLQAASRAFLDEQMFAEGLWQEMGEWYQVASCKFHVKPGTSNLKPDNPAVLRNSSHHSWAYLRIARFTSRPGHADQLHLDLWWRGLNVAQDAGSYLYNGAPPWDNSLACTRVHNTVSVESQDQMQRLGRFLWLDWALGSMTEHEKAADGAWEWISGQHDGYRRLGVIHQRSVTAWAEGRWMVEDHLFKAASSRWRVDMKPGIFTCQLHWLLPDWEFHEIRDSKFEIRISSPFGWIVVRISQADESRLSNFDSLEFQIVRGGRLVSGSGEVHPTLGWVSPTYGYKEPALSVVAIARGRLPMRLVTEFEIPDIET